jgi:aminoglycoside phosphotransferase (APT) family kinase protein
MNPADFKKISSELRKKGIIAAEHTVNLHAAQGFISNVYQAESDHGPLIIHISLAKGEQLRQKVWEKISVVGDTLDSQPDIPTASILLADKLDADRFFLVQKMLPGEVAGKRTLQGGRAVVDIWNHWSEKLEADIERRLACVHSIPIKGCGWIKKTPTGPQGMYETWGEYLKKESAIWLKSIEEVEGDSVLADKMRAYIAKWHEKLAGQESVLVHGDITNPGNILINGDTVAGFVDWELCLAGDPAWEFCFNNRYSLDAYFKSLKKKLSAAEQEEFKERARLYEPLFLLRSMHIHSRVGTNEIYHVVKEILAGMI